MGSDFEQSLMRDVKTLSETIWERRAQEPAVLQWLANFAPSEVRGTQDREMALYLLSRFTFYGSREMRECLKCLYRDLIRYPVVERVRQSLNHSRDFVTVSREAAKIMDSMKFLGVGRPSESGPHMLYYFRQENGIRVSQFCDIHELFSFIPCSDAVEAATTFRQEIAGPEASWYIFLDDFSGTGEQAVKKLQAPVQLLKQLCRQAEVCYYSVFATRDALDRIRAETSFDRVESLIELDASFQCFSNESRYFPQHDTGSVRHSRDDCMKMAEHWGLTLYPRHPLGRDNSQLLIGFSHNTPNNTLPIFWADGKGKPWCPLFRRFPKQI